MKTRINLYSKKYEPTFTFLSLNSVVFSCALLITIFAIFGGYLYWNTANLQREYTHYRAQVNQLQSAVETAKSRLNNQQPNTSLIAAIEQQKQLLSQRQRLLEELSKRESVKNNRFSQVLVDLSQSDTPDIWLTNILLSNEQVHLQGYGTHSNAMPMWLSNLSQTNTFSGTQFNQTSIQRNDQGLLFSLHTDLNGAIGSGANP